MDFNIDECYLTSVNVKTEYYFYTGKESLTEEETIKALKGEGKFCTFSSDDDPKFTELREQLGVEGYIQIVRTYWNGDRVLKPFTLNGMKFKRNDQFPCASAMGVQFKARKK